MELRQVHFTPEGVHINYHPNDLVDQAADAHYDRLGDKVQAFQHEVDTAPNHNDEYTTEIAQVQRLFEEDGLEISPIVVLDEPTFHTIVDKYDPEQTGDIGGGYLNGRCLVQTVSESDIKEVFGNRPVLNRALHEAAHSTASGEMTGTVYTATDIPARLGEAALPATLYRPQNQAGSFLKVGASEDEIVDDIGDLWEEGYCESKRVRGLIRLGLEPRLGNHVIHDHDERVRYVGEDVDLEQLEPKEGYIDIPARFADAAKVRDDGRPILLPSRGGYLAAYALELLNEQAPGIFDVMDTARKNPRLQREFIRLVDSVKPGLYRELSLRSDRRPDEFRDGLLLVQAAIAERASAGTQNY